jgi:hypothetical protein
MIGAWAAALARRPRIMLTAALVAQVTPSLRATYRTVRSEVRLARAGGFLPFSR